MILLTLLACAETWSGEAAVTGPELSLDTATPEWVVPVEAELVASTGRRNVDGALDAGVTASWEGGGALRAFWRGPELTPQPAEGEGSVELEPLAWGCSDDGYVRCTIQAEIVFEHLGLGPVLTTPELRINGVIYRPSVKRVEHVELSGAWGEPEAP